MIRSAIRATALPVLVVAAGLCWIAWAGGTLASGFGPDASRSRPLPRPLLDAAPTDAAVPTTVVFAGGCFWGVQAVFEHVKGVTSATAGYSGGPRQAADYEDVSTGTTGHAESVKVVFDPSVVSFGQLLEVFFSVAHDPTEIDRQGADVGSQYRSAIFFTTGEQERIARAYIEQIDRARTFDQPIATQVAPLQAFYAAEAYHQDYVKYHPDQPYVMFNDLPKLARLKKSFPLLYR